jgi:hypothetical protein
MMMTNLMVEMETTVVVIMMMTNLMVEMEITVVVTLVVVILTVVMVALDKKMIKLNYY